MLAVLRKIIVPVILSSFLLETAAAHLDFKKVAGGNFARFHHQSVDYAVFMPEHDKIRFLWQNDRGENYQTMHHALRALTNEGYQVHFLMNAGIFNQNAQPAGLWIEKKALLRPLNRRSGKGNFHIQPNGVFYLTQEKAHIITTVQWHNNPPKADYAVQSGPLLIIDGAINSRLPKNHKAAYKRNAVCVDKARRVYFVITTRYDDGAHFPNLYRFAHALQTIGCQQALYLDGSLSDFYLPMESSRFHWQKFAGMIAVVSKRNDK